MESLEDNGAKRGLGRRSFLGIAGAFATGTIVSSLSLPAKAEGSTQQSVIGRRKLGALEVSSVGLGVQNMSRKYDTIVPYRPQPHPRRLRPWRYVF